MIQIKSITAEMAEEYRRELAQLYYDNVRANAYHHHYTYGEAFEKMEDYIYHLKNSTCVSFGLFHDEEICGFIWAYRHQFREEERMYVNEIRIKEPTRH